MQHSQQLEDTSSQVRQITIINREDAIFYFTEGNFSCDCNRSLAIRWEYGDDAIPELGCGEDIELVDYHIEYWD